MINTLIEQITKKDAPIVVGLDPMLSYVPEHICKAAFEQYGETLEGAAEAIWQFNKGIVDATHDLIPAVKPQIAMYEQFGIPGLTAFKKTVDYCKEKGLVVIGDINSGAEVSAGGNIIVLGSIRGRVRAGIGGNREAIIAAFILQPQLLQIGDLITVSPDDVKPPYPEVARVKDGMIIVEPYLPNKYSY